MHRRSVPHHPDRLPPIASADLASVTGGRVTPRTTLDPVLLEGIQQLAAAITSIGQSLGAAKQSSSQQMMQMMQMMMERQGK